MNTLEYTFGINPYKPSQKASFSDGYSRDLEEQNSFEELFGQQYQYLPGTEEYCERYQYSQNETQYSTDDRREKLYLQFYQQIQNEYHKERPSDCVIVAISKEQMEYATAIGHRLQDHGLVVEMIYLTSESGLTRALQEVKNDGSPFCILVEQTNVALSSCTAIILHDSIKIHRNMPMEDALALVVKAFGKIFGEREQQERNEISHKAADLADDYLERELYESYSVPLDIRHLLFLLSDGKYLYSEELQAISDYVTTRITKLEGFEEADTSNEAKPLYEKHTATSTHLLDKPPPLLPTPARNTFKAPAKAPLLGDRPSAGLLPTPGFAHPNRFARLCEEDGSVNSGLAVLDEADLSNSRETSFSSSGGEESRARPKQMVVIGDSIIRKVDRVICRADRFNRTVCCLPGARVRHVVDPVDTLLGGAGHDPAILVHIGTNDKMNGRWGTLKSEFRDLGSKIKQRSSNVIFSEILPVPRASLGRQRELRELNAWLKSCC
uniref:Provisional ortholog of nuclear receptor coactivator 5 n=1 Tax=Xenopus tropicalis TaxID=8364 RepID=A0A803K6Y4_XENTR